MAHCDAAEAIITVDSLYRAMVRVIMFEEGHVAEVVKLLKKELEIAEAHERTFIKGFLRYIEVEGKIGGRDVVTTVGATGTDPSVDGNAGSGDIA